jgi:hypothetical protein
MLQVGLAARPSECLCCPRLLACGPDLAIVDWHFGSKFGKKNGGGNAYLSLCHGIHIDFHGTVPHHNELMLYVHEGVKSIIHYKSEVLSKVKYHLTFCSIQGSCLHLRFCFQLCQVLTHDEIPENQRKGDVRTVYAV